MSVKKRFLFLLLSPFITSQLSAVGAGPGAPPPATTSATFFTPILTDESAPLFTGPLIAPSVHTIPPGHYDIEPYVFFFATTGSYNSNWNYSSAPNFYTLQLLVPFWVGITPWLDFTMQVQGFYQFTQGQRSVQFGSIPFGFDIQLVNEEPLRWWPAVKIELAASIPTGKYEHLDPNKLGTDAVGAGNWAPTAILSIGRLFQVSEKHFLSPRLIFSYTVPNPVNVTGYNVWGGAANTKGTAYQGNYLYADLGLEYNLAKNWAVAIDFYYQHNNKTRFSGNPGTLVSGESASVGAPSSEQFSIAPALEYNWSAYVGVIGGVWFTVGGRNISSFITGTLALNIYI